jgi:hypothetical protein
VASGRDAGKKEERAGRYLPQSVFESRQNTLNETGGAANNQQRGIIHS